VCSIKTPKSSSCITRIDSLIICSAICETNSCRQAGQGPRAIPILNYIGSFIKLNLHVNVPGTCCPGRRVAMPISILYRKDPVRCSTSCLIVGI
jgi:hypothetical protein